MRMHSLALLTAGALAAPAALAEEAIQTLPAMEVTSQVPALESEPPALTTEVDAEKLESINSPNVEDALKYEPNLVVRKRYIGDRNATLAFRDMHNLQTARALVLGDGLLLSNFLGSGWDNAPRWGVVQPEEIERIEISYGPYSAEYGGNSLGGVVRLHTRMPEALEAHVSADAFLQDFESYGTDDTYEGYKLHASLGNKTDRLSYFLAADRLENESHPQTFGIARGAGGAPVGNPVSGAHDYSGGGYVYNSVGTGEVVQELIKLKLGYDFTDSLQGRLTVAHLDRSEDNLRPETYLVDAAGNPVYNGVVDIGGRSYTVSSQRLSLAEARDLIYGAELEGEIAGGWEIDSALSFYDVLEQTTRSSGTNFVQASAGGPGSFTEDQGSGWGAFDLKLGHRHDGGWRGDRLLVGYHFSHYVLDQASFGTDSWRQATVSSVLGDSTGKARLHAVFLENEWQLSEPWRLTLGARQEWWKAYDGSLELDAGGARVRNDYPERSESRLSPKASLAFEPSADWLLSLSLGVAYRFPTVGELFQGTLDNQGNFSAGFDPDLKTEKGFAKNLMVKRFFERGTLTLNLWENDVDNSIFRQTDVFTGVDSFQNIDRVRSRGIELVGGWRDVLLAGLDVDFNLAYTDAKIMENDAVPASEGKQFPRVPEWRANLFASYRLSERFKLGGGARYASDPYDTLDNSDGSRSGFGFTDSFLVFDARASYALSDSTTLAVGMDNLTDERYFVYHPYPGRTLFAELKWVY